MALQFTPPPDWLIQEYLQRKSPMQEVSETALAAMQTLAKNRLIQQEQKLKAAQAAREQEQLGLARSKDAREGYESAVNYGNVSGLPADVQQALRTQPQGPVTAEGEAPKEEPTIAAWRQFVADNPQGVKGREKEQVDRPQQAPYTMDGKPMIFNPRTKQYEVAAVVDPAAPEQTIPNPVLEPRNPPNLQQLGTQDGKVVFVNPRNLTTTAVALPGKGPLVSTTQTEGQANAKLYADRMDEADKQLTQLSSRVDLTSVGAGLQGAAPNILKSPDIQLAEQAKRNFLTAVLRRESGAVISPSEFAEGNRQYFPVMGDSPAVLKQKAINRQIARQGLRNAAGGGAAPSQDNDPLGIR